MALTPNATYTMNGVKVNEKIIPDGTRWKNATKAVKAGFSANSLYKKNQKLSGGTGKVQSVTIHNTGDLKNVCDDAEQYTRATYNENMNSSRVHFYVDDNGAWQNLKAGTGLCAADPEGSAEVSWHAGDGSIVDGGNMTSLSMEIIMNETAEHDAKAKDNGARMAAWLLWKHGLGINALVTHTYWVSKRAGKTFSDPDTQSTNKISGKKWCPTYIFNSTNITTAKKNWQAFKAIVKDYLDELNGVNVKVESSTTPTKTLKFKEGDIVQFTGKTHYGSANATTGSTCKPGKAKITKAPKASYKHPYHCVAISGGGSNVYGWVNENDVQIAETKATLEFKKGDIVQFTGKVHYRNGNASSGYTCKPGKAKITAEPKPECKHPYHCVAVSGGGSSVYGWVNVADVKAIETSASTTTTSTKKSITEVAKLVIRGNYGNGAARTAKLKAEGYTDAEIKQIQAKVNELCKK